MLYSFLNESVGRQLIGASKFASRKNVAQQILQRFPTPKHLSAQLYQMANQTYGKEKVNLLDLANKCDACTQSEYPKFVNSIAGFSSIWKYIGVAAGATAAYAAANYVINDLQNQSSDNPNYNIKDGLQKTAQHAMEDTNNVVRKIPGLSNTTVFQNPQQTAQNLRSNVGAAINYIPNKINTSFSNRVNANALHQQYLKQHYKNMYNQAVNPYGFFKFYDYT